MSGESTRKRAILFVQDLLNTQLGGGIEHSLQHLTAALTAAGHRCITLSLDNRVGLRRTTVDGVVNWRLRATAGLWSWREDWLQKPPTLVARQAKHALSTYNPFIQKALRHVILEESPDIVSMHNINHFSVAAWRTATNAGAPVVQVLHGHSTVCFHGTMHRQGKNCASQCLDCRFRRVSTPLLEHHLSAVVGVSHYILDRHLELGLFNSTPIKRVIYNGRDPRMFPASNARAQAGHGVRFGYIGRISLIKGLDRLIDAFKAAAIQDSELRIAGSGPVDLIQQLQERSSGANITWLGQTNAAAFYNDVDVVVVPSVCNEALGGVVFEAQHFGKVVLGSTRGGIPELITHERSGLLFDPDNPEELVDVMRRVAHSKELRERLSTGGKEASRKLMNLTRLTKDYESLYGDVLRLHESSRRGSR